jgi:hypothetical protein
MRDVFRAAEPATPPVIRANPRYPVEIGEAFHKLGKWMEYWEDRSRTETSVKEMWFSIEHLADNVAHTFQLHMDLKHAIHDEPLAPDAIGRPTLFYSHYINGEFIDHDRREWEGYRDAFVNTVAPVVGAVPHGNTTCREHPQVQQ